MLAVLADAVTTFRRTASSEHPAERRHFVETARWFASNDTAGTFSFATIRDELGLDADHIRDSLKTWRRRRRAEDAERRPWFASAS